MCNTVVGRGRAFVEQSSDMITHGLVCEWLVWKVPWGGVRHVCDEGRGTCAALLWGRQDVLTRTFFVIGREGCSMLNRCCGAQARADICRVEINAQPSLRP